MRPARVRLVDLGFDHDFDTSMAFAQSLIQSLVARSGDNPIAEIEFIRTRDLLTVETALQNPAHIIHVIAHGETSPDDLGFWSEDDATSLNLTELAEAFAAAGEGIEAAVLFADCCSTAQGRFTKAVRDCIEQPIAYIGAKRTGVLARVDDIRLGLLRRLLPGSREGPLGASARDASCRACDRRLRGHRRWTVPVRCVGAPTESSGQEDVGPIGLPLYGVGNLTCESAPALTHG